MNKWKQTRNDKIRSIPVYVRIVTSGFSTLVLVVMAVLLVGVRFLGYTPFVVLSPSMAPTYLPGTLVYVRECPFEQIDKGMVITFVINEELQVATHRVVEKDTQNRQFITKGDANKQADAVPVLYDNILGTVEFSIPKLGYISHFLNSKSGKICGFTILCFMILSLILQEIFQEKETIEKGEQRA